MPTYRLCVAAEMIPSSAFKNTYFRQQNALQPGMLVRGGIGMKGQGFM